MFASQLLRILQTIPSNEASVVFDHDARIKSKGSQDAAFYVTESFGGNARKVFDKSPVKDGWDLNDDDDRKRNCLKEEEQKGLLCNVDSEDEEEDEDSLSSKAEDEAKPWTSPDSVVLESTECNENESQIAQSASHLIDLDSNSLNDFDLPELMVCYKDPNYRENPGNEDEQIYGEEDMLIECSCISSHICKCEEESFTPPILSANSSGNLKDAVLDEYGREEDAKIKSFGHDNLISTSGSSSQEDSTDCDRENTIRTNDSSSTGEIASNESEEESFVIRTLPIEAFGTRSFLRSFLNSVDFDENNLVLSSNEQISFGNAEEEEEDPHTSRVIYSSTVESKTITFDFGSTCPVKPSNTKGSSESRDMVHHAEGLPDNRPDQCSIVRLLDLEIVEEKSDNAINGSSIKFFVTSPIHPISRVDKQTLDRKDQSFNDLSSDEQGQSASSDSPKKDDRLVELILLENSNVNSEGEMSFSAGDLIAYSGSVAYSGSLSVRSDGSGASTRSFAFPILPLEWKSPVRLESTGATNLQKHKDWKSGLFCCKC